MHVRTRNTHTKKEYNQREVERESVEHSIGMVFHAETPTETTQEMGRTRVTLRAAENAIGSQLSPLETLGALRRIIAI